MNPLAALIAIITVLLPPTLPVAHTGPENHSQAQLAIDHGAALFRHGHVEGSVAEFEKAIKLDPTKRADLWQMGISLYYLNRLKEKLFVTVNRFKEGAEQFRLDATKNRNDTEEAIWCFLCEAQYYGAAKAREQFLKVGRDRRGFMREAYKLFKDGDDPEKYVNAFRSRQRDYFYACLYAGLYYESQNEENAAKRHIVSAYKTHYGQNTDDYMGAVAKVHCQHRNWID